MQLSNQLVKFVISSDAAGAAVFEIISFRVRLLEDLLLINVMCEDGEEEVGWMDG